jgi:hypothetical protein
MRAWTSAGIFLGLGLVTALFGVGVLAGWIEAQNQALRWVAAVIFLPAALFLSIGYAVARFNLTGQVGRTPVVLGRIARQLNSDVVPRRSRLRRRD